MSVAPSDRPARLFCSPTSQSSLQSLRAAVAAVNMDSAVRTCGSRGRSGAWRSLAARLDGVQEVAGSNPVAPRTNKRLVALGSRVGDRPLVAPTPVHLVRAAEVLGTRAEALLLKPRREITLKTS